MFEEMASLSSHDNHENISPEHTFIYRTFDCQKQNTDGNYQRYYVPHFNRHGIPPSFRMVPTLLFPLDYVVPLYSCRNPSANRDASYLSLGRIPP